MKTSGNDDKRTAQRKIGDLGEEIALRFLTKKGYKLIERNYSKKWGEIDLICEKGGVVHFVEVKTVSLVGRMGSYSNEFGSRETANRPTAFSEKMLSYRPEELVDARKLKKLSRTSSLYMEVTRDEREYQIDVVGVILDHKTKIARCRLFEQALGNVLN